MFFSKFKESAMWLTSLRCITVTSLLIALDLVLKMFLEFEITANIKISFAFVAVAAIGMLYGPTVCGLACVVTDVVGFFIKNPSGAAFNPLFTLVEVTGGVLYGLFLYRFNPIKPELESPKTFIKSVLSNWGAVLRIVLAKLSVVIVCNLIMNPIFLTLTAQMAAGKLTPEIFWASYIARVFPARIIKNAIQTPVDILILIIALFPIMAAYRAIFREQKKAL